MPGLPDLSKDLAREYRITIRDARELIQFINEDMVQRLAKGEALHIDRFGSFHAEFGKIWFSPSQYMQGVVDEQQNKKKIRVQGGNS